MVKWGSRLHDSLKITQPGKQIWESSLASHDFRPASLLTPGTPGSFSSQDSQVHRPFHSPADGRPWYRGALCPLPTARPSSMDISIQKWWLTLCLDSKLTHLNDLLCFGITMEEWHNSPFYCFSAKSFKCENREDFQTSFSFYWLMLLLPLRIIWSRPECKDIIIKRWIGI